MTAICFSDSLSLPSSWTSMKLDARCELVDLTPTDQEYQDVLLALASTVPRKTIHKVGQTVEQS